MPFSDSHLAESHWATLAAAVDRIVPADEWPSASQAGVVEFLRRLIDSERLAGKYASGLDEIEAEARRAFDLGFAELAPELQDQVLTRCERESEFFSLFAAQTIEGYYADPDNGGNRDGVAWEMVGFRVTA